MAVEQTMLQTLTRNPERRRCPRTFANGQVVLSWEGRRSVGVATVLDWSSKGLRIAHELRLDRGEIVTVHAPEFSVRTRIIWVADMAGVKREAGLLYLEPVNPTKLVSNFFVGRG